MESDGQQDLTKDEEISRIPHGYTRSQEASHNDCWLNKIDNIHKL